MTTKAKKILITTETHEVWVVRRRGGQVVSAHCPHCAVEVEFLTTALAAALWGVGSRQLHRWVEDGSLHFAETDDDALLICARSLLARVTGA